MSFHTTIARLREASYAAPLAGENPNTCRVGRQDLRTALHIIERLDADLRQAGTLVHGAVDTAAQPASAPAAGEAVAALIRERRYLGKGVNGKHFYSDFSEWFPATVGHAKAVTSPSRNALETWEVRWLVDAAPQASGDAFPPIDPVQAHVAHCAGCETCDGWREMLGSQRQASEAVRNAGIAASVDQLVTAAKGMTKLYPRVWDRTNGSLVVFPENVARFDAAFDALRIAVGEAVDDDETAALSAQPGPQTEAPHDDQWTPEQLAAIESQGPAEPFEIPLVPITYPVPDEIADPCPQCVSGAVCKKPTCGRLIAQTSGQADVTLPPTPRDVADAVRLIRSCDDEAAAQVALERFANGHARAAILAHRQQRARAADDLVQEFICATDALLASQERKTWTSGYKYELTAGERIRIAERWRQLRTTLAASTQCTEDGGSNG
ncbi:hypothetical protein [Achromobacter denitrificans]|uniref:hypothetical protein n=1 Tax=Achromobacter denitrificans TaxID=32002 RepID=UPI0021ADD6F7|nr:hypothetical protein [Achromobacter denitrificans]